MNIELRLLDQIKLINHLTRNFACSYSEDDRFFILTETGIYVFDLKCNLSSQFSNLCCSKNFFTLSNFLPTSNVDLDINLFHKDLERKDLYESVMASEYSSNLRHLKPLEPYPLSAAWSPSGIVGKTDCYLAILSNTHSLEIYSKYIDKNEQINYQLITNITEQTISVQRYEWKDPTRFSIPMKLEEFKNRVNSVSVSAFAWTHVFNKDNILYCAVIAGLLNGDIVLWRIPESKRDIRGTLKPEFLGRYSTEFKQISTMHWHPTSGYGGGLIFGDVQGKVNIIKIEGLHQKNAVIEEEVGLWTQDDKVSVDKITVLTNEGRTYIVVVKQNVLIIFGVNEEGIVYDQKVEYVEEFYVTGIYRHKNILIVSSFTGVMTQFTLYGKRAEIVVTKRKIPIKADVHLYRNHGFFFSSNMMFCGILLFPKNVQQFSSIRMNVTLYICNNSFLNPLDCLWSNPTNTLRGFWDCFEVLRLICLKEKRFPWIGLPSDLNHDDLSLLQLKTLRHIAKLSEAVFNIVPRVQDYHIKPFILLHYLVEIKLIVTRMKMLFSLKSSGHEFSVFQMRSLDIQNFFLKEMVKKNILPQVNVGKIFVNEMSKVIAIANELEYPEMVQCIWCGEKLIGSSCLPPHTDSRCCFSMMQIVVVPSHKCPLCQCVAHKEMEEEITVFVCPYCDVPMDNIPVDLKESKAKNLYIDCQGEIRSDCYEDCLVEDITFDDVEENEFEFVVFSDSEDENEEDCDKLRTLYMSMAQCNLGDVTNEEIEIEVDGEPSRKLVKIDENASEKEVEMIGN